LEEGLPGKLFSSQIRGISIISSKLGGKEGRINIMKKKIAERSRSNVKVYSLWYLILYEKGRKCIAQMEKGGPVSRCKDYLQRLSAGKRFLLVRVAV